MGNTLASNSNTAIYAYGVGTVVTGNICTGSGAGVSATAILVDSLDAAAGSDDVLIQNNIIDGWTTGIDADLTNSYTTRIGQNIIKNCSTELSLTAEKNYQSSGNSVDTDAMGGEVTINGTTAVVVNSVLAGTGRIRLSPKTPSGSEGAVFTSNITAGASFSVKSTNGSDTSVYYWWIDI